MNSYSYLAAVNQKLLFAKRLIKLTETGTEVRDKHFSKALAQSVVLQLYHAWAWHLQDVASNYKVQDPSAVNSIEQLVQLLKADGKAPAEATELHNLALSKDSWLYHLLAAYQQLFLLPEIRKAEMDIDRLPLLSLDASDSGIVDWGILEAVDWTQKMIELVDRQREMMIEF